MSIYRRPNHLAGVGAGRIPEFIEMIHVGLSPGSGCFAP